MLEASTERRDQLESNTRLFRGAMAEHGFDMLEGDHPITPVMFYEAKIAVEFAERLLARRIYVIPFSYPVVPKGKARIRVQISAAHSEEDLRVAVDAFAAVKAEMG